MATKQINQHASSFLKGTIALHRPPMTPFLYLNVRICVSNSTNPCEEAKCGKNVRGEQSKRQKLISSFEC